MIFGGTATVERYKGDPKVQAHGPGFSKILLGDDKVDDWKKYLDLMVNSVLVNSGRGCINCSGIWVSRHAREIAEALFLSPKTVRNNVSIILQRLGVRDRGEAAIYATAAGLTDMQEAERLVLRTS